MSRMPGAGAHPAHLQSCCGRHGQSVGKEEFVVEISADSRVGMRLQRNLAPATCSHHRCRLRSSSKGFPMPGPFQLPALPWDESALAPTISSKTLSLHYGKHHLAYVNKLNELVAGTPYADQSLEQIIAATKGKADARKIYNNAGHTWNHNFYWNCLSPHGGGDPKGGIGKQLEPFGGYEGFCKQFA